MDNPRYKFFIGFIMVALGVAVIFMLNTRPAKAPIIPAFASQVATPSPDNSATTTILAPDGKMTLIVTERKVKDGIQKVISAVKEGGVEVQIYSKTESSGSSLSIPYNTFSPDDKYIFLKETTQDKTLYYVFSTDGKPLTKDSPAVEITSLFYAKYADFKITDMTGWGGMNLIVINTNNNDGSVGPSFWFEVPGMLFIRLSSRFN